MFFNYFTFGKVVEKRILVMLSKFLSVDLKSSCQNPNFQTLFEICVKICQLATKREISIFICVLYLCGCGLTKNCSFEYSDSKMS